MVDVLVIIVLFALVVFGSRSARRSTAGRDTLRVLTGGYVDAPMRKTSLRESPRAVFGRDGGTVSLIPRVSRTQHGG